MIVVCAVDWPIVVGVVSSDDPADIIAVARDLRINFVYAADFGCTVVTAVKAVVADQASNIVTAAYCADESIFTVDYCSAAGIGADKTANTVCCAVDCSDNCICAVDVAAMIDANQTANSFSATRDLHVESICSADCSAKVVADKTANIISTHDLRINNICSADCSAEVVADQTADIRIGARNCA